VYKGKYVPEKKYVNYALYVMFFPQLVAGPIERPQHLLPQFAVPISFDATLARRGFERMLWGFFKKVVIADQLAQIINPFHLHGIQNQDGSLVVVLAILFTYQIYCDFSGYSDIAIGSAQLLGFTLTENFNRPFAARTFADFWRRWHMSLSSWLRDYLYYPLALGWGRVTKVKLYVSTLVTFVLIGLWHGANWTFVAFGALHGIYLVVELATEKFRKALVQYVGLARFPKLHHTLQTVLVFVFVTISFVIFRADTIQEGIQTLLAMPFSDLHYLRYELIPTLTSLVGKTVFLFVVVSIVVMEVVQYKQEKAKTMDIFGKSSRVVRYGWYYALTLSILLFGYFGAQAFIYFQF
jgi:alginate O-acetyltransferase complex protein AlgI